MVVVGLRERETRMTSNDRGSQTGKYSLNEASRRRESMGWSKRRFPQYLDRHAGPGWHHPANRSPS